MGDALLNLLKKVLHSGAVVVGAVVLTLACFLVLPIMQSINKPPTDQLTIQTIDVANVPPPPPIEDEEPEEEEEPEPEPPPELTEEAPPLDLSQLELALNPGFGDSGFGGDYSLDLKTVVAQDTNVDALFSMSDLDQKPRVMYQPGPNMTARIRNRAPGTVYVIFIVDQNGRVVDPKVQQSTDPIFEKPALDAIKKWKFEPGKRQGEAVRFRMRIPMTFPKG